MLFNFQGPQPNLVRLAAPLGTAYLLYHVVQILSSTFFNLFRFFQASDFSVFHDGELRFWLC